MKSRVLNYIEPLLNKKSTINWLAFGIVLLFTVLAIIRLMPYENSLPKIVNGKDDWSRYARLALDIKRNGLSISSISGTYFSPNGFLYNYFVAGCFFLFGENTFPVYIIQNFLLGLSVVLVFFSFRETMKPLTGIIFLFALTTFALLDVSKHYSFRLLSENLAIFTVSAFFYCFIKGTERKKSSLLTYSALFLGLSILVRPNIFPAALICLLIAIFWLYRQKTHSLKRILIFTSVFALSSSFLAIRNYYVCGSTNFLPTEGFNFGVQFFQQPSLSLSLVFKKIIFIFGFLNFTDSAYQIRPHWILLWTGYLLYLFQIIKARQMPGVGEVAAHLFILCYYGVLILIAEVGSYGFRYLIPGTFVVLPFAVMGFEKLFSLRVAR